MSGIPVLDLSRFGGDEATDREVARDVGRHFRDIGFMSVVGHGIDQSVIDRCFDLAEEVFSSGMTLEQRLAYEFKEEGRQMGYTPIDTEVSVGHKKPNRMQFWHVNDPKGVVRNEFPHEVPEFGPTMLELLAQLKGVGQSILRALAIHLGRAPQFFTSWADGGENLLRVIHYPALNGGEDVERSGAHTDINLVTLLVPARGAGLEVQGKDGEWIPANTPDGALVVNMGDMMSMHTFGELPSTMHRVVNPGACGDRFSMPLFIHPPKGVPLVSAGAFKMRRLREIKLLNPLPAGQIDY